MNDMNIPEGLTPEEEAVDVPTIDAETKDRLEWVEAELKARELQHHTFKRDDDGITLLIADVRLLWEVSQKAQADLAAALARAQAAEGEVKRLEAVVSRKQVVIESHWKTIERASKRCALLKSAAHDVYDMCFENDDQKQVRHLRRVLKVLGTKLYRSPNGE